MPPLLRRSLRLGEPLNSAQRTLVAEDGQDSTSSIHHCGKRTPRRMRQTGSALRKPIRSFAAEGFWSGVTNGERQDPTSKPLQQRTRQGYWDRLLMSPDSQSCASTASSTIKNQD